MIITEATTDTRCTRRGVGITTFRCRTRMSRIRRPILAVFTPTQLTLTTVTSTEDRRTRPIWAVFDFIDVFNVVYLYCVYVSALAGGQRGSSDARTGYLVIFFRLRRRFF